MSFDWASFAQGFMERTSEKLEERKAEGKQFEKDQRAAAERNVAVIQQRRSMANIARGHIDFLRSNGAGENIIQATLAAGPAQLKSLTKRTQEAIAANRGQTLTEDEMNALITLPEDFTPVDMDLQDYVDRTFGVAAPDKIEEDQEEFGFMDKLFGRDQMDKARGRLDNTSIGEGMTISEINRAAQQAEYQSLIPSTFVSIVGATDPYDIDFNKDFFTQLDRLVDTEEYKNIEQEVRSQEGLTQDEYAAEIDRRQGAMKEKLLGPFLKRFMTDPDFLVEQENFLRTYMGDAYVDGLMKDAGLLEEEKEEDKAPYAQQFANTTISEPAAPRAETLELDGSDPAVDTSAPAGLMTPNAEPGSVDDVQEPEDNTVVTVEGGTSHTYADWKGMSRKEREAAGLPTSLIGAQIYFNRFGVGITGKEPEPADETEATVESGDTYTYADWKGMSRSARIEAGLPTSLIGAQFYFNRFTAGITGVPVEEDGPAAADVTATEDAPEVTTTEEGDDAEVFIPADDLTISLLNSDGAAMLEYLRKEGVTSTDEMSIALREWAQSNGKMLPGEITPLIASLKPYALDQ